MAKWDITRVPSGPKQASEVRRLEKQGWETYTVTGSGEINLKRRSGYVAPKATRKKKSRKVIEPDLPVEVEVEPEINHSEDTEQS